ncbi:hypothetical protein SNEBB_009522 [Seison nebaliae]|nr:hypothetical protein SNEBB_009522 [Seison nebaliae]
MSISQKGSFELSLTPNNHIFLNDEHWNKCKRQSFYYNKLEITTPLMRQACSPLGRLFTGNQLCSVYNNMNGDQNTPIISDKTPPRFAYFLSDDLNHNNNDFHPSNIENYEKLEKSSPNTLSTSMAFDDGPNVKVIKDEEMEKEEEEEEEITIRQIKKRLPTKKKIQKFNESQNEDDMFIFGPKTAESENKVFLFKGANHHIDKHQLKMANRDQKSVTRLLRNLMDLFFDRRTLAISSLTGSGKTTQQLRTDIMGDLFRYCKMKYPDVADGILNAAATDKCVQIRRNFRRRLRIRCTNVCDKVRMDIARDHFDYSLLPFNSLIDMNQIHEDIKRNIINQQNEPCIHRKLLEELHKG